jgi:hypothetical protein
MRIRPVALAILFATSVVLAQVAGDVPAYHKSPPPKGQALPPVLTQKQLAEQGYNQPVVVYAYKAAARMPAAMYQQPCYCHCDRGHGHSSLHSCFESTHGANCGTCIAEALYTYQMSKKGWTASQIRDGIVRGDWKTMDLQHPEPVN